MIKARLASLNHRDIVRKKIKSYKYGDRAAIW